MTNYNKLPRFFMVMLMASLLSACAGDRYLFTSFHEPADEGLRFLYSKDARNWTDLNHTFLKPGVGTQKVMRDPSVVRGPDGTFHLVWTSSWKGDKGFGYANSKDLVHWSEQKFIPVMENEPATVNVWAPELFYDEDNKQFIIIWASTIPFRFPKGEEEEENNHRMYYTVTKDFDTFSPAKLFYNGGFSVIDAVIVKRGKADFVLVLKDNTRPNRNIRVAYGKTALGPYTGVSPAFTSKFSEGPSVVKTGDQWLIYYDAYQDKKYSAVQTTDFKIFTDARVSVPAAHKHGTIVKVPGKVVRNLKKHSGSSKDL